MRRSRTHGNFYTQITVVPEFNWALQQNYMIDKTAIIYPGAVIDESTEVGPYTIIKGGVKIGKNNQIAPHVVIEDIAIKEVAEL